MKDSNACIFKKNKPRSQLLLSKFVPQNNPKRNPPPILSLNFNPPKRKCYHLYQSLHHTLHETFHRLPFSNMSTQPTSFLNNIFCRHWPHFSFESLSSSAYETKLLCTGSPFTTSTWNWITNIYNLGTTSDSNIDVLSWYLWNYLLNNSYWTRLQG